MVKMRWDNVEEVGDTSNYVSSIGKHIKQTAPLIRTQLGSNRKYFTNFCMKFVTSFMPKVIAALQKCKQVCTVGAEQLLLDMQSMRVALLELPSVGAAVARKAPGSYAKRVTQGIGKAEMILKVIAVFLFRNLSLNRALTHVYLHIHILDADGST